MRLLILEQQPDAPAALLGDWASARGHGVTVAAVPSLSTWPDPREFDAIASLGSDASVHASTHPWIADELDYLRAAHELGTPILGICFGGQALARALGGEVAAAPAIDVSWRMVPTLDPELVPAGPWFRWHSDRFTPPPGARALAAGEDAFALGTSIGLQFHPEVDPALAEQWLEGREPDLAQRGIDMARLRREIAEYGQQAPARAFDLFDRIAAWWRARSIAAG